MGTAAGDDGIKMQKDQVTTIANNVIDLDTAAGDMSTYNAGDGLTAAHFGGVVGASNAGALVLSTMAALASSVAKAQKFLHDAGTAMTQSVAATSLTDEEAMWGVTKAGKGA
jgi:hypothetical protein